jgi:hypothetical protein
MHVDTDEGIVEFAVFNCRLVSWLSGDFMSLDGGRPIVLNIFLRRFLPLSYHTGRQGGR